MPIMGRVGRLENNRENCYTGSMSCLAGKIAIITGAASGIGNATAQVLAEAGIGGLSLVDLDGACTTQLATEIQEKFGINTIAVKADVSDGDQVAAMVKRTLAQFHRIDILVNNAGIAPVVRWSQVTEASWRHVIDTNLNIAFLCMLAVLPTLKMQQSGRIVNISSAGAILGSVCAHPAYGTSKAGMIAMTKSAAKEFATDGILVNAIAPGGTPKQEAQGWVKIRG